MAATDLSHYMPKCAICFQDARTSSHYLVQLSCYHIYCNYCVQDIQSGGKYFCPFDGQNSESHTVNKGLQDRAGWLITYMSTLNDMQIRGQVDWLKKNVNYYMVFCRFQGCQGSGSALPCPLSHTNMLESVSCPQGGSCWRRATCPYGHGDPGTQVSLVQTIPSEWYYSTVQVQANMQRGSITIRSLSGLNFLVDNGYAQLHAIFQQVLGTVPQYEIKTHETDFRCAISWLYLPQSGQVQEFPSAAANQLEQTYRLKGNVITIDAYSCVYLNPLVRLYQNGAHEPVARVEKLNSTSDAAVLDVICDAQYFANLYQAIKVAEEEMSIGQIVSGETLKRVCLLYGLSTRNDMLIGTRYSLSQAQSDLASNAGPVFPSLLSIDVPASFPLQLVSYLCNYFGLILAGQHIYGASTEVQSFLNYLTSEYSSVPVPAGTGPQELQATCQQYGLVTDGVYMAGPREVVRSMSSVPTFQAAVPTDVDPARLMSLPSHVPVRVEGGAIIGTRANVNQALQMLPRRGNRVRYPASLPKATVQAVAQKYGLKADNTHLSGDSASIFQALDELNQMPIQAQVQQGQTFQFHRPADWYQRQTTEMELQNIASNSQEFQHVATRFNETMGQEGKLVGIQRVQNRRLYTNFAYKHEAFCKVEGKALEIMQLFHGTSQTDPAVIFQSDSGLDSRLGRGLWGQGTYYAKNSYYSHDYCSRTPANQCQMFLCLVLVGDYVELDQNEKLVRPPNKKGSTSSCYHSVKGVTPTSDIWITYEAAMSYPLWLITYEAEPRQQTIVLPPLLALLLLRRMMQGDDDDDDS